MPLPTPSPTPLVKPTRNQTPTPKPSPTASTRNKATVTKNPTKDVAPLGPQVSSPQPTIGVGSSDIVIQGLNQGERIRVKIISRNSKSDLSVVETQTTKIPEPTKVVSSKVSIDITPTLDSTLKKGAQIAVRGAKKNQRVRVTVR
jgi:hypothetical protein